MNDVLVKHIDVLYYYSEDIPSLYNHPTSPSSPFAEESSCPVYHCAWYPFLDHDLE